MCYGRKSFGSSGGLQAFQVLCNYLCSYDWNHQGNMNSLARYPSHITPPPCEHDPVVPRASLRLIFYFALLYKRLMVLDRGSDLNCLKRQNLLNDKLLDHATQISAAPPCLAGVLKPQMRERPTTLKI